MQGPERLRKRIIESPTYQYLGKTMIIGIAGLRRFRFDHSRPNLVETEAVEADMIPQNTGGWPIGPTAPGQRILLPGGNRDQGFVDYLQGVDQPDQTILEDGQTPID